MIKDGDIRTFQLVDAGLRSRGFKTHYDVDGGELYLMLKKGKSTERWSPVFSSHADYMEWCVKEYSEVLRKLSESKTNRKRGV